MNRDYALPGFVAMALVVLYPIYWLVALNAGFSSESLFEAFRADAERLDLWDVLFVAIGVMEITVYLSLRNLLKERLNSDLASALLMLMAIFVALFTVIVVFDLVLALGAGSCRVDERSDTTDRSRVKPVDRLPSGLGELDPGSSSARQPCLHGLDTHAVCTAVAYQQLAEYQHPARAAECADLSPGVSDAGIALPARRPRGRGCLTFSTSTGVIPQLPRFGTGAVEDEVALVDALVGLVISQRQRLRHSSDSPLAESG